MGGLKSVMPSSYAVHLRFYPTERFSAMIKDTTTLKN